MLCALFANVSFMRVAVVIFLGPLFAAEQRRPAREFGRALGELGKR
jgi:hypothetical protein